MAWTRWEKQTFHFFQLPHLILAQLTHLFQRFSFSFLDRIDMLRYRRTDPESLPEIVAENAATTQIWSDQNWYRVHIGCQHRDPTVFTSVPEKDVKLPFFIPGARHATEDPDHVQVKVLELLSGTLLPVVRLPFIDIVNVDRWLRSVRSAALRETSRGMSLIFISCSSSSRVRCPGFIAWYHATNWGIAISSNAIQQRKSE
ncbi:uncharacterized protein LOC115267056 isoform X1 [Aedes albopictus]|uniref:Uncharacterized protein n=2 Tax=Aedes albopictus TaxID=7160 RepID=A0ABM1XP62_AEDAL